jgi:hypothetical protein
MAAGLQLHAVHGPPVCNRRLGTHRSILLVFGKTNLRQQWRQRCRATTEQEQEQQEEEVQEAKIIRRFKALGSEVIEYEGGQLPEPPENDFWEGEHWEVLLNPCWCNVSGEG